MKEVVYSRLLPAWLLRLDGNVIEMLHRLDVENCAQTALETLKAIFRDMPTEELLQNRVQLDNRYTSNPVSLALTCDIINKNVPRLAIMCVFQQEADPSGVCVL